MKTRHVLAAAAVLAALFSGTSHATWLRILVSQPLDGSPMQTRNQVSQGGDWRAPDPLINEDLLFPQVASSVASPMGVTIVLDVDDLNVVTTGNYDFYQPAGGSPVDRMSVSRTGREVTIEFLASTTGSPLTSLPGARSLLLGDPNGDWDTSGGNYRESILVADGIVLEAFPLYVGFQRIPEPGTAWLLCGAGFGIFGASLRRQRHGPAGAVVHIS